VIASGVAGLEDAREARLAAAALLTRLRDESLVGAPRAVHDGR